MPISNKTLFATILLWPLIAAGGWQMLTEKPTLRIDPTDTSAAAREIATILRAHPEETRRFLESWQLWQNAETDRLAFEEGMSDAGGAIVFGPSIEEAAAQVLVFYDINCPHCRAAHVHLKAMIEARPDVRVVMRNTPILGQRSIEAALVEAAIAEQGLAAAFLDAVMELDGEIGRSEALTAAFALEADNEAIVAALNRPDLNAGLAVNGRIASQLRLRGTPLVLVNGERLEGTVDEDSLAAALSR